MTIRPYTAADLESVARLFTETVRHVNRNDYSSEQIAAWAPQPPDLAHWRQRVAHLTLWIAELDRCIAGFCGLGAGGYVDLLYVDYRLQRRGIAHQLYQSVESAAIRNGVRRMSTEASITARPFFECMGFVIMREQQVERRGVIFRNYAMEKHLAARPTPKPEGMPDSR